MLEIRLLGPVEVRRDGGDIRLAGEQQRGILAALALRPGRVVSAARLIHLLWGESPSDCAGTTLRWHVHRLRQALGAAIVTRKPGYALEPGAVRVDAAEFEEHVAAARGAGPEQAAARLRAGLGLWRGAALADVRGLEAAAAELEERRLAALELCLDAELALGRHAELVPELSGLLAAEPLRERTRAQLMLALHRCGRRAEALAAFRDGRRQLVEELGVEPGDELQRVHREVLGGEGGAAPVPAAAHGHDGAAPVSAAAVPPPLVGSTQLPADIGDFTGRRDQLAEVVRRLREEPAAPRSVVVSGPAGVGKTTLAVHAAHLLRDAYPDGRLFVNLRGFGPAPADPAVVLGRFLRYLGVEPAAVPEDPEERQELYRAVLARRRVLVVLDNAATESQAAELLPGGPGCGVLVTSRRRLALPGARTLDLANLDLREAVALLSGLVGDDRVAAEPEFAGRLAALCGHLPLALRIAAARLVVRPHWTVGDLAERMADERHRLDELAHGDLEVRATVGLGHRFLDPPAARAFTLLGLLHTPDFAPWTVAALLGTVRGTAEEVLDRLADARLVEVASRDGAGQTRYRCHDLVRLYAREQAGALPEPERREALGRLFAAALWLTRRVEEATDHFDYTAFHGTGPTWPMPAVIGSCPRAWMDAEWPVLTALVGHAAALGMAGAAWELTAALTPCLEAQAQFSEMELCAERALAVCREHDDRLGEAVALQTLAYAYGSTWRYTDGERCCREALAVFDTLGHDHGSGVARTGLSIFAYHRGDLDAARSRAEEALTALAGTADGRCRSSALRMLGLVDMSERRLDRAEVHVTAALRICEDIGTLRGEGWALHWSGMLKAAAGEHEAAVVLLRRALDVLERAGDLINIGTVRTRLAESLAQLANRKQARRELERTLAEFDDIRVPGGRAAALRSLARVACDDGDHEQAIAHSREALALLARLSAPAERIRALRVLADALDAAGRTAEAARTRAEAGRRAQPISFTSAAAGSSTRARNSRVR